MCAVPTDPRCKIAFIGSHGVGKTTLSFGLAARLRARDISLEVVHEVARRCPLPINEETSVAAQSWILHTQVAEELVEAAPSPVVLCDRSVLDNYVYLLLAAGDREPLCSVVATWMTTYQLLVHVPIVGRLLPDGIRAAEELVAAARYPVVLCDRSVLDNYVYLLLAAGDREPLCRVVASGGRS